MSFRIAVVPLDDRPCNFEYLEDLVAIAGIELALPPQDQVRSNAPRFDFASLKNWLESTLPQVNATVINLEGWIYGGLIRSRKMEITAAEAGIRLETLAQLLKKYPQVQIYLSSVLLRLSVTLNAKQSEQNWRDIFRYSVLSSGSRTAEEDHEIKTLLQRIPFDLLQEYLDVRARNHQIQLEAVRVFSKSIRYFIFGQEDCGPRGLHLIEKTKVREAIIETGEANRFLVLTGADELGACLLYRAYSDQNGAPLFRLGTQVSDPATLKAVSLYEDIPVYENLRLHAEATRFQLVPSDDRSLKSEEPRLLIQSFLPTGQMDLCFSTSSSLGPDYPLISKIREQDSVLDLGFANGADPQFMEQLLKRVVPSALSAWNTTGNRMGTLFAQIGFRKLAQRTSDYCPAADRAYLIRTLLDDYFYQSRVRQLLQLEAESQNQNVWALDPESHRRFSMICELRLREAVNSSPLPARLKEELGKFSALLPWPRFFEALIRVRPSE